MYGFSGFVICEGIVIDFIFNLVLVNRVGIQQDAAAGIVGVDRRYSVKSFVRKLYKLNLY